MHWKKCRNMQMAGPGICPDRLYGPDMTKIGVLRFCLELKSVWISQNHIDIHVTCSGAAAFGLLCALPAAPLPALLLMTAGELAIAFSDVVIDGVAHLWHDIKID